MRQGRRGEGGILLHLDACGLCQGINLTRFLERLFSYLDNRTPTKFLEKKFNTENTLTICPLVESTYQGWLFFSGSEWTAECSTKPNFTNSLQIRYIQSSVACIGVEGVEGAEWNVRGTVR